MNRTSVTMSIAALTLGVAGLVGVGTSPAAAAAAGERPSAPTIREDRPSPMDTTREDRPSPVAWSDVNTKEISIWVANAGGKAELHWVNSGSVGKYDYVGLYNADPHMVGPEGYIAGAWQWVSAGVSYVTSQPADGQHHYWVAYVSWDYANGRYVILATAEGTP
jgi:hypothetical protein